MFQSNNVSQRFCQLGGVPSELRQAVDPLATVDGANMRTTSRKRVNSPNLQTRVHPKTPSIGSSEAGGSSSPRGQYSTPLDESEGEDSDNGSNAACPSRRMPLGKIAPHVALRRIQRCVARMSVKMATALPMVRKPVLKARISKWLMDTGSGLDLVSKSDVRNMKHMVVASENPVMLATANGVTTVDEEIALRVEALDETIKPFVLESTPSVLTVGWRCMELG